MMKRWAIFISGTGSNMTAILEKQNLSHVSLVVSSNPNAYGLKRAQRRSIPTIVFDGSWNDLIACLKDHNINHIMLAGFMKILPSVMIKAFEGRIFNIHPSTLPDYPGLNSIERAFKDGKHSGCSVHKVDEGVDTGEVLLQKKVTFEENLEWTKMMVHIQEHNLSRKVLAL